MKTIDNDSNNFFDKSLLLLAIIFILAMVVFAPPVFGNDNKCKIVDAHANIGFTNCDSQTKRLAYINQKYNKIIAQARSSIISNKSKTYNSHLAYFLSANSQGQKLANNQMIDLNLNSSTLDGYSLVSNSKSRVSNYYLDVNNPQAFKIGKIKF